MTYPPSCAWSLDSAERLWALRRGLGGVVARVVNQQGTVRVAVDTVEDVPPDPPVPGPGTAGVHGAPRIPSWLVPRGRLVARLDSGAPLTVVRAPGGGGKTTLLTEWAHGPGGGARGVWADAGVGEPGSRALWGDVVQSIADAGVPDAHPFSAGRAALPGGDLAAFLVRGFRLLGPFVVIIDGADALDERAAAAVVHLVAAVPTTRVIVSVRTKGPFESAHAHARTDVAVLGPHDLALDITETAALLGVDTHAGRIAHRTTEGSPLATRLLALTGAPLAGAGRALEEVAAGVVDDLGTATAAFVTATATADLLSPELAATLSGTPIGGAAQALAHVEEMGLGTWTGEGPLFAYTPVVRSGVRSGLRRDEPARFRALRRTVAVWSDEHGHGVEALRAAVDADDLDLATAVARRAWRTLLLERTGSIRPALHGVRLRWLHRHPVLLFLLALGYNADPDARLRAVALFGYAATASRLDAGRVPPHDRLLLRLIEMVALRLTGRGPAAARAAADVVRRADELTPHQREQVLDVLPVVYAQAGTTLLYDGRAHEAMEAFDRGVSAATTPAAQLPNLALLAGTLAVNGAMDRVAPLTERVRAGSWPPGLVDGYSGALYHVAEAVQALEELDTVRAQRHLDVLEPHLATIEHWPLITQVQAFVDLVSDGPEPALVRFDADVHTHGRHQAAHRASVPALEATRAMLLVAAGRPLAALELLPRRSDDPAHLVALARARLHAGRPEGALEVLSVTGRAGRTTVRGEIDAELLTVLALVASGRAQEAGGGLARAAALLTLHGLRLPLALLSADDRATLSDLAVLHGISALTTLLERPSPQVVSQPRTLPSLTPRESVVLRELTRTGSAAEIAEALVVSPNTVKSQLRALYRKLGVTSRQEALVVARRIGLLAGRDAPPLD